MLYIVNPQGQKLSRFEHNDLVTKNQLKYSLKHWISFETFDEADTCLLFIKENCKQRHQANALRIIKNFSNPQPPTGKEGEIK